MAETTRDLLIEIGTEELPPTALRRLSEALTEGIFPKSSSYPKQ